MTSKTETMKIAAQAMHSAIMLQALTDAQIDLVASNFFDSFSRRLYSDPYSNLAWNARKAAVAEFKHRCMWTVVSAISLPRREQIARREQESAEQYQRDVAATLGI